LLKFIGRIWVNKRFQMGMGGRIEFGRVGYWRLGLRKFQKSAKKRSFFLSATHEPGKQVQQFLSGEGFAQKPYRIPALLLIQKRDKLEHIPAHINGLHPGILLADIVHQLYSVSSGHVEIRNHHLRPESKITGISIQPIPREAGLIALILQYHLEERSQQEIIIDNQYLRIFSLPGSDFGFASSRAKDVPKDGEVEID
jgi:hypothetical protein